MSEIKKIDPKIIEKYKELRTPEISDAMDKLGLSGALFGVKSVVRGTRLCGQAFTLRYTASGEVKGNVGDFIDDVEPGQIVVIDNKGRLDCTVWGDIMSIYASKRGVNGAVIDGVCRDIEVIEKIKYPIFTKGTNFVTGKDRVHVDGINVPISVSGVQVAPGDLMIADDSGALVIPYKHVEEVLKVTLEIEEKEQLILKEIEKGTNLKEARKMFGYHSLQSKK